MLERLRQVSRTVRRELQVYRLILRDPRTPWLARLTLGLAVGYLMLPFDIVPDFIPVLGHLDDLIIVPGLVILALKLIPEEVVLESRDTVRAALEE